MRQFFSGAAVAGLIFGFAACGGGQSPGILGGSGSSTVYQQVELFARPAVKEGLEVFNAHDTTNRTEPYNDPTLKANISDFMTTVAGRSAATAGAVTTILGNDELVADLSSSATKAAYLGVETGGFTGSTFGGRALSDDAIDLDLGVLFGNTFAKLGVVPDDGKESPCLTTDNVGYDKANIGAFPYVQPPV
jgi:hypothetical protein